MSDKKKEKKQSRDTFMSFTELAPGSLNEIPDPEVAAVVSATEMTGMLAAMPPTQMASDVVVGLMGAPRQHNPDIGDGPEDSTKNNRRKYNPNP